MNKNGGKNEKSRSFYWIKWKFCVLYIYINKINNYGKQNFIRT